jgi:DNA-3-methyladenine glycosylase I
MNDAGIIRHRGKINAIIHNAQQILTIQQKHDSFFEWIEEKGEITLDEWIKVFKKSFKFVGKEIVKEFLMSTGFIEGAHEPTCLMYKNLIP